MKQAYYPVWILQAYLSLKSVWVSLWKRKTLVTSDCKYRECEDTMSGSDGPSAVDHRGL